MFIIPHNQISPGYLTSERKYIIICSVNLGDSSMKTEMISFLASLHVTQVTEFLAAAIAAVAIPFGIGGTAWRGYVKGACQLPRSFILTVNSPLGVAMFLRMTTFLMDEKYKFLILVDFIGFVLAIILQGQSYGFFLKKKAP